MTVAWRRLLVLGLLLCLGSTGCALLSRNPKVAWDPLSAPRWATKIVGRRVVERKTGQVWIVKSAEQQELKEPWNYVRGRHRELDFDFSRYYSEMPKYTVFALASADGDEAHPMCRSKAQFRRTFCVRPKL